VTVVAIDGPAGAGKSTVARELAHALGWRYVDTGAMYRALAFAALERGIEPTDGAALGRLASCLEITVDGHRVTVSGADVSGRIRAPEVTRWVSEVSAHPEVRSVMVLRQRRLAAAGDVVMEGRDIGTAVVPNAEVKVYLTASLPIRARRRARDLGLHTDASTLAELERELARRDATDASRATSPLSQAPDAMVVDATDADVDTVVRTIVARIERSGRGG
jgi:cytidylate kinase